MGGAEKSKQIKGEERMRFIMYQNAKGQWEWELRAVNGNVIAIGVKGYQEERKCRHAITLIQGARHAPIKVVK
jgi:uncharacterized protein YegP (UPF0339 family)